MSSQVQCAGTGRIAANIYVGSLYAASGETSCLVR